MRDYYSSTGEPDAEADTTDSDDNGYEVGNLGYTGGYVRSSLFTLTPASEASYDNDIGITSEPRVDFGFHNQSVADLEITKTDNKDYYLAGSTFDYTIVVTNNGPSDITGATVTDSFPASITSASWSCVGNGSASCGNASGTGNINETVNIPFTNSESNYVTYTVTVTIDADATGDLINMATVTHGSDTASATDTDHPASLTITKDDGYTVVSPGATLTYTINITNNGAVDLTDLTVTDTLPSDLTYQVGNATPTEPSIVGNILTWNHADLSLPTPDTSVLASGESTTITFQVLVNDPPSGTTIPSQLTGFNFPISF